MEKEEIIIVQEQPPPAYQAYPQGAPPPGGYPAPGGYPPPGGYQAPPPGAYPPPPGPGGFYGQPVYGSGGYQNGGTRVEIIERSPDYVYVTNNRTSGIIFAPIVLFICGFILFPFAWLFWPLGALFLFHPIRAV